MGTTTLATLLERFSDAIEDWIQVEVTTDINNDNSIVSTNLNEFDGGQADYFNDWFVYIEDQANEGVERQVNDYTPSTGKLTIRGAALVDDGTDTATIRVARYKQSNKVKAVNRAIEIVYPALHQPLDDITLVTGNILPDGSFEWWTSSSALNFYSTSSATLAQTTTAGLYRGQRGTTSAKVTVSAANGYMYISSDDYPILRDLMGKTVSLSVWAYPEVADDASIVIYTKQADGTEQTLTSTTSCPAGEFTLLELNGQTLNDNLTDVQIRFKVATNAKYTYFDDARVFGVDNVEFVLPVNFQDGYLNRVFIRSGNFSSDNVASYYWVGDTFPYYWHEVDFELKDDGVYKYLQLGKYADKRHIRLEGYKPLATLSAQTDVIATSDNKEIKTIVARAALELFEMMQANVSSEDTSRFSNQIAYWSFMYNRLLSSSRKATVNRRLKST